MTTPSDPLALLRSRSYVALLVLAAIIGVPVSAAAYFLSRPGQQDAGLDLHPLFQGEARQGLDLGLAAADVALIAFPRQEQEAFEVAAAFVDDAVDLPCGGVRGGRRCRRSGAARLLRPMVRAGSYSTGIRAHRLRHARRRQARDPLSPHREWAGGGVYRWRGDYGLLGQGRRRCPHISSRLRRQTRLAKSRQHLVRDRANRRSR